MGGSEKKTRVRRLLAININRVVLLGSVFSNAVARSVKKVDDAPPQECYVGLYHYGAKSDVARSKPIEMAGQPLSEAAKATVPITLPPDATETAAPSGQLMLPYTHNAKLLHMYSSPQVGAAGCDAGNRGILVLQVIPTSTLKFQSIAMAVVDLSRILQAPLADAAIVLRTPDADAQPVACIWVDASSAMLSHGSEKGEMWSRATLAIEEKKQLAAALKKRWFGRDKNDRKSLEDSKTADGSQSLGARRSVEASDSRVGIIWSCASQHVGAAREVFRSVSQCAQFEVVECVSSDAAMEKLTALMVGVVDNWRKKVLSGHARETDVLRLCVFGGDQLYSRLVRAVTSSVGQQCMNGLSMVPLPTPEVGQTNDLASMLARSYGGYAASFYQPWWSFLQTTGVPKSDDAASAALDRVYKYGTSAAEEKDFHMGHVLLHSPAFAGTGTLPFVRSVEVECSEGVTVVFFVQTKSEHGTMKRMEMKKDPAAMTVLRVPTARLPIDGCTLNSGPLRVWTTRSLVKGITAGPQTHAPAVLQSSLYGREFLKAVVTPKRQAQLQVVVDGERIAGVTDLTIVAAGPTVPMTLS